MNGVSLEFIIHPGETLKELIEDREMSQKELAVRTGNSPKHISDVVNCLKPISVDFAKKLEYALTIDASFWINLQANYAKEMADFEEVNHISNTELKEIKVLKDVIEHLVKVGFLVKGKNKVMDVINLRRLLNISSLDNIPEIVTTGAYRVASSKSINPYILFTWLRMCELYTKRIETVSNLDVNMLKSKIPEIKKLMFKQASKLEENLQDIFAECGIKFAIVKHFTGAPVQGVIAYNTDGSLSLIMTIRQASADIFWFTLMHEITHIINGDIKKKLIDYEKNSSSQEEKANDEACRILLNEEGYQSFVNRGDYTLNSIKRLAVENKVKPYIVIGRLQREKRLTYDRFESERVKYVWSNV